MIQQLRIYEIFDNNKAAFHARFSDHAARIMRARYGFRIVAMWETRFGDRTEFAYLLEWPDETTKSAAWSAFMADAEWSEIKRVTHAEHGLMVGESRIGCWCQSSIRRRGEVCCRLPEYVHPGASLQAKNSNRTARVKLTDQPYPPRASNIRLAADRVCCFNRRMARGVEYW